MIGMAYVRLLEMTQKKAKRNPYARIKEWRLFRKRILNSKKKYDRKSKSDKVKDIE